MSVNVEVPFVGEGVPEMRVVRWLKGPGDPVHAEEPLVEVTTEKIDFVIEAPATGTLVEVRATAGTMVTANQVVGVIAP